MFYGSIFSLEGQATVFNYPRRAQLHATCSPTEPPPGNGAHLPRRPIGLARWWGSSCARPYPFRHVTPRAVREISARHLLTGSRHHLELAVLLAISLIALAQIGLMCPELKLEADRIAPVIGSSLVDSEFCGSRWLGPRARQW